MIRFSKAMMTAAVMAAAIAISAPSFAMQKYQSHGIRMYQSHSIAPRTSRVVRPYNSHTVRTYNSHGLRQYKAHTVHALTKAERARMIQNDRKAAKALAKKWTRGTGSLNQNQLDAIHQIPVR
jgi:hypothetical protein